MGLNPKQREHVTRLKVGEAVVGVARLQRPVLLQVRPYDLPTERRDLSFAPVSYATVQSRRGPGSEWPSITSLTALATSLGAAFVVSTSKVFASPKVSKVSEETRPISSDSTLSISFR
jgi:hypothetical protein